MKYRLGHREDLPLAASRWIRDSVGRVVPNAESLRRGEETCPRPALLSSRRRCVFRVRWAEINYASVLN